MRLFMLRACKNKIHKNHTNTQRTHFSLYYHTSYYHDSSYSKEKHCAGQNGNAEPNLAEIHALFSEAPARRILRPLKRRHCHLDLTFEGGEVCISWLIFKVVRFRGAWRKMHTQARCKFYLILSFIDLSGLNHACAWISEAEHLDRWIHTWCGLWDFAEPAIQMKSILVVLGNLTLFSWSYRLNMNSLCCMLSNNANVSDNTY